MASGSSGFVRDVTHLDRSAFKPGVGLRTGAFVLVPVLIAYASRQPILFFAALGSLYLFNTEGLPPAHSGRVLLVACFAEAAAVGLGTLAATTGALPSQVLLGFAVFVVMLARGNPKWAAVAMFTSITFAVGVALPGYSVSVAGARALLVLVGALWALAGVELQRFVVSRRQGPTVSTQTASPEYWSRGETLFNAILLGVACGLGFALGFALGLPRDFWVVITILFTVRPRLGATLEVTAMMAGGTIVGAVLAAAITLETSNEYVLSTLLFIFAVMLFSTRGVNIALTQVFITPFIIILINIIFPGQWYLALYRILEVGIGVMFALVVVYIMARSRNVIYREP